MSNIILYFWSNYQGNSDKIDPERWIFLKNGDQFEIFVDVRNPTYSTTTNDTSSRTILLGLGITFLAIGLVSYTTYRKLDKN